MVSVNAENWNAGRVQQPFPLTVPLIIPVIVNTNITKKDQ